MLLQLINLNKACSRPLHIFLISAFFVFFGFLTSYFIFYQELSSAMLSFSSMMILPYILKVIQDEKVKEPSKLKNFLQFANIFQQHNKIILIYTFMFFGMVLEYMLLFSTLPPDVGNDAFRIPIDIVKPAGELSGPSEHQLLDADMLISILSNNIGIVLVCFALSLFWGTGSIFILNLNASVVGMVYGTSIRALIYGYVYPMPIFRYPLLFLPHTILEMMGFLLAAIGGSIMMKSVLDEKYTMRDPLIFLFAAIFLIILAGYVEVTLPFLM